LRSHPKEYIAALEAFEETELLGRGDRYMSSGMLAVAADATAAVEAAKRAAAAAAAAEAAAAAAAAAASAAALAAPAPLPADSANKNTATVTVVRGGSGVGLDKAGSEKKVGSGVSSGTTAMTTAASAGEGKGVARTTSTLAAALARVLHRSCSAPKATTALIESITTSAGVWSSPFGAVSANVRFAATTAEKGGGANERSSTTLALARSQSLGCLPAVDFNAMAIAAGIVFPESDLEVL
jgi:hypothetical protein